MYYLNSNEGGILRNISLKEQEVIFGLLFMKMMMHIVYQQMIDMLISSIIFFQFQKEIALQNGERAKIMQI